jgi:hypothetical protein
MWLPTNLISTPFKKKTGLVCQPLWPLEKKENFAPFED